MRPGRSADTSDRALNPRTAADSATEMVQLVLPNAADIDEDRVSVFTPVGAALFGLTAGQAFAWEAADGARVLRILEVTDDDEAA